jgi:uncharacterized protein (TIGR00156 family)
MRCRSGYLVIPTMQKLKEYHMRYLLAPALTLALCVPAFAAFDGPTAPGPAAGGFQGPASTAPASLSTVAQALQAPDDAYCVLEGNIIARAPRHHERYIFQDTTGKMTVEIDDKLFAGRTVTPQTRVRLHGEIDLKRHGDREVDVDVLEILK